MHRKGHHVHFPEVQTTEQQRLILDDWLKRELRPQLM